ncbi:hypothetical protein HF263_36860 [Rhizobium leguminosarum]|uniref:hypothetical protein n=1 Tax=Rhizobium leguminosarum TaxID=384 RepID=UPI001C912C43|nr:hypothetical protein [Rhizobium leguminosarum]MBY2996775.1 hypothetical protein [Rhizobium leguminosarum]MBY3061536.1 hypothetical protein [Rhizobium leguminosarum]
MSGLRISEIQKVQKLSPSNFKTTSIGRSKLKPLRQFLHADRPYDKGIEPGRASYQALGDQYFLRNSCINENNVSQSSSRYERFVGAVGRLERLKELDVLLCKDANIGDACLYVDFDQRNVFFSSGIVRLNFKDPKEGLFCLAMIRDEFFRSQLDARTPRGSTIRHAGDAFLDCLLPELEQHETWTVDAVAAAVQNIAYAEMLCDVKIAQAAKLIQDAVVPGNHKHNHPRLSAMINDPRLDAGFYSEVVTKIELAVSNYSGGSCSINDFGFTIKRGPNLQKRDMGRSVQTNSAKPGYHALIYPSSVSERGYVEEMVYIGARSLVWHIETGGVLFSAEGSVGRTYAVCDDSLRFITNIHGLIFTPQEGVPVHRSAFLCMYFHTLRRIGYFEKVSVGGQGGSFAVSYWDRVRIPLLDDALVLKVASLYTCPTELEVDEFNLDLLQEAGVYELGLFRDQCLAFVRQVVEDLKNGTLKPRNEVFSVA